VSLVRLVHVAAEPGKAPQVEALLRDLVQAIRAQPGCEGATAFGEARAGAYGLFVLWGTEAQADAAREVIGPRLMAGLEGKVREAPDIRTFEVLPGTQAKGLLGRALRA
jgi:hypothetical protein